MWAIVTVQTAFNLSDPCCCNLQYSLLPPNSPTLVSLRDAWAVGSHHGTDFPSAAGAVIASVTGSVLSGHLSTIRCRQISAGSHQNRDDTVHNSGRCLKQAFDYLMTVPATSIDAETAFSAAGILCSKLSSSLGDNTLDTLCFLRSYYLDSR